MNIPVYFHPTEFERNEKLFVIGHGDGLGPGDHGYKRLKKIFRNPACQWLFGILPPAIGVGVAGYLSRRSRRMTGSVDQVFLGEDKEWLIQYCKDYLKKKHVDYFVFGHRHLPITYVFPQGSTYLNLGDWINHFTYAVFDGHECTLLNYEEN